MRCWHVLELAPFIRSFSVDSRLLSWRNGLKIQKQRSYLLQAVALNQRESFPTNVFPIESRLSTAMVDEAIQISKHKPNSVVTFQRKQCKAEIRSTSPKDYDWNDLVAKIKQDGNLSVECEEMKSTDELYLLYTSGTTGKPKGIISQL
jgi:long-subunit acyl-CoA synthetase (AMP-forming)